MSFFNQSELKLNQNIHDYNLTMRWAEIIRLRLATGRQRFPIPQVKTMTQGLNCKVDGLEEVRIYRHALTPGDFAIQILWETDEPQPMGSMAGLSLCQDLTKFGLIAHFVWVEDIQNLSDSKS